MCCLKLAQDPTQQGHILNHELTCHPACLLSPEMHALRSFTAKAVGSSLSELVLPHEHNLRQMFLDLRVITDCRNMGHA